MLIGQRIRRASFHSVVNLQAAINHYLAEHHAGTKPFVWTASAASILASLGSSLQLPFASKHYRQAATDIYLELIIC